MIVTNAEQAEAWLAKWGDKMRPGLLESALAGARLRRALLPSRSAEWQANEDCITVLQQRLQELQGPGPSSD